MWKNSLLKKNPNQKEAPWQLKKIPKFQTFKLVFLLIILWLITDEILEIVCTGWNLSYRPAVDSITPWCLSCCKVEVSCRSRETGRIEHITLQQNKKYPSFLLSDDLPSVVNQINQRRIICQWHRWVPKAYFSTGEDPTQHLLSGVPPCTGDVCVNCCNNFYRINKTHKLLLNVSRETPVLHKI